jgi:hypothetical protein
LRNADALQRGRERAIEKGRQTIEKNERLLSGLLRKRAAIEKAERLKITRNDRSTVEKLAADCLDVRQLHRVGTFKGGWKTFPWASFRWPCVEKMRAAKFLIHVEFYNQTVPQNIRVSWTWCKFGGSRPWMHCPFCDRRVARLFKGLSGYYCRSCCGNPVYESQRRSKSASLLTGLSASIAARRLATGNRSAANATLRYEA